MPLRGQMSLPGTPPVSDRLGAHQPSATECAARWQIADNMAYDAIVYGCIDCFLAGGEDWRRLWRHNRTVIDDLPERGDPPLWGRRLFSVDEDSSRIQVVHFGGAFKNFAPYWRGWLERFEGLLRQIYWNTARVHIEDEELGRITCRWEVKGESWHLAIQEPPVLQVEWDFTWQADHGIDPRQFPAE